MELLFDWLFKNRGIIAVSPSLSVEFFYQFMWHYWLSDQTAPLQIYCLSYALQLTNVEKFATSVFPYCFSHSLNKNVAIYAVIHNVDCVRFRYTTLRNVCCKINDERVLKGGIG